MTCGYVEEGIEKKRFFILLLQLLRTKVHSSTAGQFSSLSLLTSITLVLQLQLQLWLSPLPPFSRCLSLLHNRVNLWHCWCTVWSPYYSPPSSVVLSLPANVCFVLGCCHRPSSVSVLLYSYCPTDSVDVWSTWKDSKCSTAIISHIIS